MTPIFFLCNYTFFFIVLGLSMGEVKPLSTLESVLSWSVGDDQDYNKSTIPYKGPVQPPGRPRTLLCHDMAGGYLHDRYIGEN